MLISRRLRLRMIVGLAGVWTLAGTAAVQAQSAVDAANQMAGIMASAEAGVSSTDMLSALEGAAAAGQPLALWRLGIMYESGTGVEQDRAKAFSYFSRIADQNADTAPRGLEADIVAQSFVKMGDYYRVGLPDAGIAADAEQSRALLLHAASYFGDADAQYRVGMLFLDETSEDANPLQGARWLSLAARKGHLSAQAVLGDMLFNGTGVPAQPVEGLMWLTIAHESTLGTEHEVWVNELLTRAMSIATPEQRTAAIDAAHVVSGQLASN